MSIVLNAFLMSTGHHESSWRLPESDPGAARDVGHFQRLAQLAESGSMDSVFFADSPSIMGDVARRPSESLDPTLLLSAMAAVTERIGLVATASTTYEHPYNLARTFATLDVISSGRAGWNVVTTAALDAGANFGFTTAPSHAERYARATEFLEVVTGLWSSWADDAVLADKRGGVHTDPARVSALDHAGEHFQVRGPLNVGRSPQGSPVLVQAGSSVPGMALAARYAEAVFTAQPTIEEGRSFYTRLKAEVAGAGRDPEHCKILPGLVPVLGGTEAEARALEAELDALVVLEHPLRSLSTDAGVDLELDAPLPDDVRPAEELEGNRTRYQLILDLARRESLTVRQLLLRLGSGRGHRSFVGTPEQVADTIEEWVRAGAADGFNVMPPVLPRGLEDFVEHVVPVLQRRGLFRREYTGSTLRDHYGLPVPGRAVPTPRLAAAG